MLKKSTRFLQAQHRTSILITTTLSMIFLWACLRIPESGMQIVTFSFLSAVRISFFKIFRTRLKILSGMIVSFSVLQYIVSATHNIILLNVLLSAAASYIILRFQPAGSAYPVLLTGFLTYSAAPGVYAAAERIIDILLAATTALVITFFYSAEEKHIQQQDPIEQPLPEHDAFIQSFTVSCALLLYKKLSMPQGLWIVLTIIFIYMARRPGTDSAKLVRQRIISVPLGIIFGGIYSGTAVMLDYRLAYLAPFIGAVGFFMLYFRNDFLSFSLFFMIAFTVCADLMTGIFREFNFSQLLFARSTATIIGATLLSAIEKYAAYCKLQASAT